MLPLILNAFLAQAPAPVTIRLGDEVRGELPVRIEAGRNTARAAFALELAKPGPVTVTLDSLDFDARVEVEVPGSAGPVGDDNSGDVTNAWIVVDAPTAGTLRIEAAAHDERGGEFVLLAREGRIDPPTSVMESFRRDAVCARFMAERARTRGEHERAAKFFGGSSRAAFACGRIADAKEMAEAEMAEAKASGAADLALRAWIDLGAAEQRLGNLAKAEELLANALEPTREMLAGAEGEEAVRVAAELLCFVCQNLADLRRYRYGSREAIPLLREAIAVAPRAERPDFEALLSCKLGVTLDEIGSEQEARAAIDRGVVVAETLKNKPHILAEALVHRARHAFRNGRPLDAWKDCESAMELEASAHARIDILGTLANACIHLGRYERAQSAMVEIERLCDEVGTTGYEIPILQNRAKIVTQLGDLPRARRLLEEALALQDKSGSLRYRADLCGDLAVVLERNANYEEAAERYRQALDACEATGDREAEVRIHQNLGHCRELRGELQPALESLDRAAELAEQIGEETLAAQALGGRGHVLHRLGRNDEARTLVLAAIAKFEQLGEHEVAADAYDTLARIAFAQSDLDAVEEALRVADRLFESHASQQIGRFASAGLRSRFAPFGEFAQDLARERVARAADPEIARAEVERGWIQAGHWKGRVLLEGLKARVKGPCALAPKPLPRMAPRVALLEYVDGREVLRAYVAVDGRVDLVDLGERAPLETAVRQFVKSLSNRALDARSFAAKASSLHERLLAPLLDDLPKETEELVIVPTATLAALPFEALVPKNSVPNTERRVRFGDLRYVIDDFVVSYSPSSSLLAELERRPLATDVERYLVLGDPVYLPEASGGTEGALLAAARPSESLIDLDRLKQSREEVMKIGALLLRRDRTASESQKAAFVDLDGERSGSFASPILDLRFGSQARPDILRGDMREYRTIHIAAHGHVDTEDPRHSGLLLSWEPKDQGFVPLADVLEMRLAAELVVLSACDTASGRVTLGEGVQSLANAFLEAGARSVLASLWRIEDRDAAEIMQAFYARHLGSGAAAARALRDAKLDFRRSRASGERSATPGSGEPVAASLNPCYWAPFVLIGASRD